MNDPKGAISKIIQRCWDDRKFQDRFVAEPSSVLKEEGIEVPKGLEIKVVVNTDTVHHLAIPAKPSGQLGDEALDAVAGGAGRQLSSSSSSSLSFVRQMPLTGLGGGTHDPGNACLPNPC